MATLNQCSFIGRLGKDPALEVTSEGKPYTKFSLAVDQGKDQEPLWLNITCWGELAETMERLLYKGAQVFVQGKLKRSSYKGKDKVERQPLEITATIIELLDKAKKPDEQTEKG